MYKIELTKDEYELLVELLDYINEEEGEQDDILCSIINKLENGKIIEL